MRIAHHHATTLAFCRELQVPVEVVRYQLDSSYLYQQNATALAGRRIRVREARTDLDGYVAELLSKAVSQGDLDQELTRDDRENLLEYLRRAGALDERARIVVLRGVEKWRSARVERPPRIESWPVSAVGLRLSADDAAGGGRQRSAAGRLCRTPQRQDRVSCRGSRDPPA